MNYDYIHFIFTMCKILLGDRADSSMSKKRNQKKKTIARNENKSCNNKKHFMSGSVNKTQHMGAEIGPLIPLWSESAITAEKRSEFQWF